MTARQERLSRLESALSNKEQICSSEGVLGVFPPSLCRPFRIEGVGLVICRQGSFTFLLNQKPFSAKAGDTLFLPKGSLLQVQQASADVEVHILIYQTDPIRDFMGNSVVSMHLYSHLATEPCYVWNTGEEEEVLKYLSLLDSTLKITENPFNRHEQQLLLLALTHRLCSVYTRKLMAENTSASRKHELFIRLVQLIEQYYTEERGVGFYADKLCLSPKYLSALSKSICGYTVQELVFKSIVRKSISLLKNTQKNVQEISDFFNFPNASYFGTFFRKQTGMSPQQYRRR